MATRGSLAGEGQAFGVATCLLSSADVDSMLGQQYRPFEGGIHTPTDAGTEPDTGMAALG